MPDSTQTFGAATALGTYAGWKITGSTNPATSTERGQAMDELGNEVASKLFNTKTDYSGSYECNNDTNTLPTIIGALVGTTAILTGINITTSNKAAAKMDLSAHNHATVAHTNTLLQAVHGITVSKFWGGIDFLGGTGDTGATVVSGTISIACQHQDVEDEDGDHCAGQNNGCMITATTVWQGIVTTAAEAGWDVTANDVATSNTGVKTTTITATKKLTLAAPTP